MRPAEIAQVDINTTAALLAAGDLTMVVVGVREDEEWRFGRAPGAVQIPMSTLQARVAELDRTKGIVCVCRSGNRSSQVTAWLSHQGFDAVNLTGGMNAWSRLGQPLVAFDGRPGTVI